MIYTIGLLYSFIASVISLYLLDRALKNKDEITFLFSLLFILVSWSGIEWALWILGHNLFELVLQPIVPLASFFLVWTMFIIYIAETKFKRRDWILFVGAVAVISIIARLCMDCVKF